MSLFSPPPKFSPKLFFSQNLICFSYFYRGRRFFLKPYVVHRGSCFLGSLFSLILLLYKFTVYLLIGFSLSICDKKLKKQMKFSLFIQGEMKLFLKGGEKKKIYIYIYIYIFNVSNLGGELVCMSVICLWFHICCYLLFICLYFHTCGDVLF